MKKILSFLLILSGVFSFSGCDIPLYKTYETDFFTYIEYGDSCAVRKLTDAGTKLSELYISAYLNDKPVTKVGEQTLGSLYFLESDHIEYLNYPYTIKGFLGFTNVKNLKTIVICRVEPIRFTSPIDLNFASQVPTVYVPQGYAKSYNELQGDASIYHDANVSFMFNYEDAPNKGFYSVDYKKPNELLTSPKDPQRKGFLFGGWYEEESCLNQWDFNNPVGSEKILYALWINK